MAEIALAAQPGVPQSGVLERIAQHEATMRPGLVTRFFRAIGRTAGFAALYRRIGPKLDTWLQRRFKGSFTARIYGIPALLIVTTGAKSGLPRTSPLLYVRDGDDFIVVGTNFGQEHHPAWTNNLQANPRATIEVGPERLTVDAVLVSDADFPGQWNKLVQLYPGYAGYLARSGRHPRMFRLRAVA